MVLLVLASALALVALIAVGVAWLYRAHQREAVDHRADLLLRHLLTPEEIECLQSRGHLDVPSRTLPRRVYRIPADPGLVTVIDDGVPTLWLCAQPVRSLPASEHVLVHKLLLEGAESEYWRRANQFVSRGSNQGGPGGDQVVVWIGRAPGVLRQR